MTEQEIMNMTGQEAMAKMGKRFTDEFAIIGRLYKLRRDMKSLKETATYAVDLYCERDNEQYPTFKFVCAQSQHTIKKMKEALAEVDGLIDLIQKWWYNLNNNDDE